MASSPATDSSTGARRSMAVGMNLESIVDWSPAWTFTNAFLASRPWITLVFNPATWSDSWDDPAAPLLDVAPDGTIRSLRRWMENGVELQQQAATLMFRDIGGAYPAGRYVAEWDGKGDVSLAFDARLVSTSRTAEGRTRALFDVTPSDAGILLRINATDATDPVRNIQVWMPDDGGQSFTGQRWQPGAAFSPFHPLYLERLAPFRTLRFMGMQETNSTDITSWAQRRSASAVRQSSGPQGTASEPLVNGMSVEYMIALANALDADPWFNMPHQADDDFVRQFATTVRQQLEPGRKVYVEWANEVWNFAWGFEASQWVAEQVRREGLDPGEGQWIVAGREARRDLDIWSEVFAGQSEHTLVRVAAGWAANDWVTNRIAEAMNGAFDAIAIAPYITPTDAQRASYGAGTSVATVLADTRANIATSAEWVQNHAALSESWSAQLGRPIDLLAYEGGIHLDGRGEAYQNAFYQAGLTAEMGDIYGAYLQALERAGLDLYMDFQFTGQAGAAPWGDFAKLHRMDEPLAGAHRYNAVVAAARAGGGTAPLPVLAIAPANAQRAEGQSGLTSFTFSLRRQGEISGICSVDWAVTGSGASPAGPADFRDTAFPRGRETFAAGQSELTITLQVVADGFVEADETFAVTLSNPVGASLAAASVTGTILNDDASTDVTAPMLHSLAVEGRQLLVDFREPVVIPGLSPSRFGASVDGVARTVLAVEGGADQRQLRLTLSGPAPRASEIVRLLYNDASTANDESGVVQDAPGNDMPSIAGPGRAAETFFSATSVTDLASTTHTLTLTGSEAINGSGNSLPNRIIGNGNANVLAGRGGADHLTGAAGMDVLNGGIGLDTLSGGIDGDVFRFNTTPHTSTNRDVITDFVSGADRLSFARSVYAGFSAAEGSISAAQFRRGIGVAKASTPSQRFLYDVSTGILSFDQDGSLRTHAPIQVAVLGGGTPLLFTDVVLTA